MKNEHDHVVGFRSGFAWAPGCRPRSAASKLNRNSLLPPRLEAASRKGSAAGELSGWKTACAVLLLCAATAIAWADEHKGPPPPPFETQVTFDGANGSTPESAALVQGIDGNFYGTTTSGGANGTGGTVFQITPNGTLTTLYGFCSKPGCVDGSGPAAGLVLATDGSFYGTTEGGGAYGHGTVFKISLLSIPLGGQFVQFWLPTTLYNFCSDSEAGCPDGNKPEAGLVQATDGNFYGTTSTGGANGFGTVFKITPAGTLTTLYRFCSEAGCADGSYPYAGLVQASDGSLSFYGTTTTGGSCGSGTVFNINSAGTLTTLYSFHNGCGSLDGAYPYAGLVQASDGNLYGTTLDGGASYGTVFKINPAVTPPTLTTLHRFCSDSGCTDGENPYAGLVQASDGNFYGTTQSGGANGDGTIFKITPKGTLTTLHSFDGTDGTQPTGGLVQGTSGILYGTTPGGGADNDGTIFSLDLYLPQMVVTLPTSGKVGTSVIILGTALEGATGVNFNGTPAKFVVLSDSEIETTVPKGATTGLVSVPIAGGLLGTLKSNVPFSVP
jgi:uncharacterized repeat protein (TIGR03803 family)